MSGIQAAKKPLSLQAVEALSAARGEPQWLLKRRLEAWRASEQLEMPSSRYTQVRGLDLYALELGDHSEGPSTPEGLAALLEPAEAAGWWVQVDGTLIEAKLSSELARKGVIFTDIAAALEEHPDLVHRFIEGLEEPADKISALQRALFSGGPFLYVPQGVKISQPFKAIQIITRPHMSVFTQGFVIAEPESAITYVEELYSPEGGFEGSALQAGAALVRVGRGAEVNFAGVEDWDPKIYSFIRRRGLLEEGAKLNWTFGWLGGRFTVSHVESILNGPGSRVEDVQVFFTAGRQHFDLTSNLLHQKPHTKGEVNVKGVLKGRSRAVFWGLIRIEPGAQGANAFQSERSLILEDGPRSNAIPSLEIEADDVRCTHAASVSQIDEEQIFYLMSRGLTEIEARRAIIEGFFEPTIAKIPLPVVRDRLRALIDRKWQAVV